MLTKAKRDEIRARADAATKGPWVENPAYESMVSATELWTDEQGEARDEPLIVDLDRRGPDREFVRYARTDVPALLDALDSQDAEVARLTADNDRLLVIAKAEEWQARYWAEHDAVADREATIMAERAKVAAMRLCLVRQGCACRKGNAAEGESPHKCSRCEMLESNDAGAELLKRHAEELQGWWDKTKTMAADLAAVVARKDLELAAYRKALETYGEHQEHCAIRKHPNCICGFEAALKSSDPGKALLDAHATELAEAKRDTARLFWLETSGAWEWAEWYISRGIQPDGLGLRAAIDAAMAEPEKKASP